VFFSFLFNFIYFFLAGDDLNNCEMKNEFCSITKVMRAQQAAPAAVAVGCWGIVVRPISRQFVHGRLYHGFTLSFRIFTPIMVCRHFFKLLCSA